MKSSQKTADESVLTELRQAYGDEAKARGYWKHGAGPMGQRARTARTLATKRFSSWRPKAPAGAAFARVSIFAALAASNSR